MTEEAFLPEPSMKVVDSVTLQATRFGPVSSKPGLQLNVQEEPSVVPLEQETEPFKGEAAAEHSLRRGGDVRNRLKSNMAGAATKATGAE